MNNPTLIPDAGRRYFPLLVLALAGINIALFFLLALPYRLFPSDDQLYLQGLQAPAGEILATLSQWQNPVYWLCLLGCSKIWALFSTRLLDSLIVTSLAANTATILALCHITLRLTGHRGWALLAGLLFMTSAWTNTYYFFFSYTPIPTALMAVAFACMLTGIHQPLTATAGAQAWPTASGAVLGLALWSAPSATVLTAILLPMIVLCHRPKGLLRGLSLFGWQMAGFIATAAPFARLSFQAFGNHVVGNIYTDHYDSAMDKFSYVPQPPAFTFLRIIAEYSPLQTLLAMLVFLMLCLALVSRRHTVGPAQPASSASPLHGPLAISLILAAICLAHAVIIDLLPTTKLGRAHFHVTPFLTLFLVVAPCHLLSRLASEKAKGVWRQAYCGLLILAMAMSAMKSLTTRAVRFSLPGYLASSPALQHLYLLREDPHANYIGLWLDDQRLTTVPASAISAIINGESARGAKGALLVGPNGPGSGNSILEQSTMADFNLPLPPAQMEGAAHFPYYSFYPPFLFEEEICQSLYAAGQTPAHNNPGSTIKVLTW